MNENISYWLISLVFFMVTLLGYVWFRGHVFSWLRAGKRLSKTRIKKLQKGKKNYWWYEALHKEVNLGFIYHLNKAFTVLFVLTFALTLLTGLKKEMTLLLCPLHILFYTVSAITMLFSRIQENLDFHGTPFVIFARSSNGGVDSVIFDAVMIGMSFMPAYAVLLMTAEIWGISLPNL